MNEEKLMMMPTAASDVSTLVPPKRKKGRPPKNRDLVPAGENSAAPLPQKPYGRGRKPKRKNGDVAWPAVDNAFVGQQVHGVLDGSFDAGYLLTVRVGNTQTVLRGAVFEPTLSVPISQANDIAPHVRFINRTEQVAPLLPCLEEQSAIPALPSIVESTIVCGNMDIAPLETPPMQSAPAEHVSMETAPMRSAPIEYVPIESAPGEHVPMESAPAEHVTVESAPADHVSIKSSLVPIEDQSSEPGPSPTVVTTECNKDAPHLRKDYGMEERAGLHAKQARLTENTGERHGS